MNEMLRKTADYYATAWRREQGLPPPPDEFKAGDKVVHHARELTPEEYGQLSPLMQAAMDFRREMDWDMPSDRNCEFVAYGVIRGGKQLVLVVSVDEPEEAFWTLDEELEHEVVC